MDELTLVAEAQLTQAQTAPHGRAARLLLHQNMLRQSLIALTQGSVLGEHENPHAGSVLVIFGEVQFSTASGALINLGAGELQEVPQERHDLMALSDAVVLLTTVTGVGTG